MRLLRSTVCMVVLLLSAGGAAAAQGVPLERRMGFEVFTGALDTEAAETQGTADRMWGGQLNFGVTAFRVLSLGVDGGFVGIRDRRPFTEETTEGEMESTVGGVVGSLVAGLHTPPLGLAPNHAADVTLGVNGGLTWVGADRSINRCIDCTLERVRIHAGGFWEPALHVFHGKGGLSARYRVYGAGSDLRNALMIGYVLRTGRRDLAPADPQPLPPTP